MACDPDPCGVVDVCDKAIEVGMIGMFDSQYYQNVTNAGAGDSAQYSGSCSNLPSEFGADAEDLVYHFGFEEAFDPLIYVYCNNCTDLDQKLTMYMVNDCGDVVGSCVTGPNYSGPSYLYILGYQFIQPGEMYYLVIDGLTPGATATFDVWFESMI